MTGRLEGRRAVITGASRGIGAAIARALDGAGASTLLVARNMPALDAVCSSLQRATPLALDLADPAAASNLAAAAPGLLGGDADILVNNAGIFPVASIEQTTDDVIDRSLALNLGAPLRLLRAFLPGMRARRSGHIVTIGSIADRVAYAKNAAYAATKFGERALHEVARAELGGSGVRATLISPGPTDTPLWDALDPDNDPSFTPRAKMLGAGAVADAVLWAVTRPDDVNVDELRLSRS
ncbi:MAG TPA: SDR family NAD(P)-dependent oxidoreductase [Gemmatimonadaceae bacterium]|nr:SDR family NAD(P)-dependent oxidoreductase [Gemmatimonadaceae bacterium]